MASTSVFLLRHGEVHESWHGRVYGALDVPLSRAGRVQGERAARALAAVEFRAVVSSGLLRTEQAAALLRGSRDLPRMDDPALRELERGSWAGRSVRELEDGDPAAWQAWFRNPSRVRPPGGENLQDLANRVNPRIAHWAREFDGESIAIVTHGWVVRVLVCKVLDAPLDLAPRLDVRTGDAILLRVPNGPACRAMELAAFALDMPSIPGMSSSA